jgi:hypothetical protein
MLAYRSDKVFVLQFWPLDLYHLAIPFGAYSRFAPLWTFMGFSTPYAVFAGAVEVLGAMLLFFRRTTTLGALILCGALTNVVILDFCYGVPVRLFFSVLFFFSVCLLAPEARHLLNFFVLNRPVSPASLPHPFRRSRLRVTGTAMNLAFLIFSLYWIAGSAPNQVRKRYYAPKRLLCGVYQVEPFTQNGKAAPQSDSNWRRVIFESKPWDARDFYGPYCAWL